MDDIQMLKVHPSTVHAYCSCMMMHDACRFQSGSYEKDQNAFWDSLPDRNSCCQGTI